MAATDARPVPIKNTAFRLYFEFRKNDGTIITTVTGADTEVSKDGASFADATNEFTEIGTTGIGYIDLTSTEMDADCVSVKATCTNTDAVPTTIYLYPNETGDIDVDLTAVGGSTSDVSALATNVAAILVDTGTTLDGKIDTIDGIVDAILVDTGTTLDGKLDTIDTNVDSILADTGTDGVVVATGSKTGYALSAAGIDAIWDEDITTHRVANSAGAAIQPVRSGTCQNGGSTTTVKLDTNASTVDDAYKYHVIMGWVTADGSNKFAAICEGYVGSTRVATINAIPYSPDSTYTFVVLPFGAVPGATAPTADDNATALMNKAFSSYTTEGTVGAFLNTFNLQVGTAQAGAASSITLDTTAGTTTDQYKYQAISIRAGTGAGQTRQITAYTSGRVATVNLPWTITPDNTSEYVVHPLGLDAATVTQIAAGVWNASRNDYQLANSFGEYVRADALRISGNASPADTLESILTGGGGTITANLAGTVSTVTTLTGHTPQTGDAFARLGAPVGASISADLQTIDGVVDAILVDTADMQPKLGTPAGASMSVDIAAIKTQTAAIETDTQDIQSRLPAALTAGGNIKADIEEINGVTITGDGSGTPFDVA